MHYPAKAESVMTAKGRVTATWLDGELPFPSTGDHCATGTFNELCCADIDVDLLVKDVVDATTQCSFETDVNLLTNTLYPEGTTDDELLTMNSCYNDIVYHLLNMRRENNFGHGYELMHETTQSAESSSFIEPSLMESLDIMTQGKTESHHLDYNALSSFTDLPIVTSTTTQQINPSFHMTLPFQSTQWEQFPPSSSLIPSITSPHPAYHTLSGAITSTLWSLPCYEPTLTQSNPTLLPNNDLYTTTTSNLPISHTVCINGDNQQSYNNSAVTRIVPTQTEFGSQLRNESQSMATKRLHSKRHPFQKSLQKKGINFVVRVDSTVTDCKDSTTSLTCIEEDKRSAVSREPNASSNSNCKQPVCDDQPSAQVVLSKPKQHSRSERSPHAGLKLWQFLLKVLVDEENTAIVRWISKEEGTFRVVNSEGLAKLWGKHKNRPEMNYDKLSRAMRYYYHKNLLDKIPKRLCYQFQYYSKWWEKLKEVDPMFQIEVLPLSPPIKREI